MARRDELDHNAGGPFAQRMKSSGYAYKACAEDLGAGYHTVGRSLLGLARNSAPRANMLLKGVTQMGIAAIYEA